MKWEMAEGGNNFIYELDENGYNKWSALFENNKGHNILEALEKLAEAFRFIYYSEGGNPFAVDDYVNAINAIKKAKGEI